MKKIVLIGFLWLIVCMWQDSAAFANPMEVVGKNNTVIIAYGSECHVIRQKEPEDYLSFRRLAKAAMQKLLEAKPVLVRARVTDKDLEEIIVAVYDATIIFPDLQDLRHVEICKLFQESGFIKKLIHRQNEKGIGAIRVDTGLWLLEILEQKAKQLSEDQLKRLNRRTTGILGRIKRREINSGNIGYRLVTDCFFNILCSACYDDFNLRYFNSDVHLMLKAYQRGTRGTVETNYLSCIDSFHRKITGEPIPRYVMTEGLQEQF